MYNNLHLLIPNFQSILALIPHLPRKASVPLIQISGCSIVASNPTPPPPPSLPPGTYCSSSWARGSWVPVCVCVCVCVCVSESLRHVRLFETQWTVAHQALLSMKLSRQEYWSGLLFPSLGIFLTQGWNPGLLDCRQTLYCLGRQGAPAVTGGNWWESSEVIQLQCFLFSWPKERLTFFSLVGESVVFPLCF